jgi:site-specific DNA-cytosine methylase
MLATWPSSTSELLVSLLPSRTAGASRRDANPDLFLRRDDPTSPYRPIGKATRWGTQGIVESGACLTGRGSEHSDVVITCSLSDIAERPEGVPSRYFYTPRQCRHMLRRAARRGRELPERLRRALERQARLTEYLQIVARRKPTRKSNDEAEALRPARQAKKSPITAATLFTGIGAPEAAMPDWNWLWGAEVDQFAATVLAARFPGSANLGDVTADDFVERAKFHGRPDVLVWGAPCQPFSIAGRRLGLDDPRGNLALVGLKIVREIEPHWFIFENVPGILSSSHGSDFAVFLSAVEDAGYLGAWRVLDSAWFGVPQRRRRVFFVGHRGDWRPPAAVLFQREAMFGHEPPCVDGETSYAGTLMTRSTEQYIPDVGEQGLYAFLQSDDGSGVSFWTADDDSDLGMDAGWAGTLTTRSIQDKMPDHNDRFYGLFQDGDRLRTTHATRMRAPPGVPDRVHRSSVAGRKGPGPPPLPGARQLHGGAGHPVDPRPHRCLRRSWRSTSPRRGSQRRWRR